MPLNTCLSLSVISLSSIIVFHSLSQGWGTKFSALFWNAETVLINESSVNPKITQTLFIVKEIDRMKLLMLSMLKY